MALIYCDSSVLVKLVVAEAESDALQRSARRLGSTLAAFVAYDTRLAEAAEALRFTVVRPGVPEPPPRTGR